MSETEPLFVIPEPELVELVVEAPPVEVAVLSPRVAVGGGLARAHDRRGRPVAVEHDAVSLARYVSAAIHPWQLLELVRRMTAELKAATPAGQEWWTWSVRL